MFVAFFGIVGVFRKFFFYLLKNKPIVVPVLIYWFTKLCGTKSQQQGIESIKSKKQTFAVLLGKKKSKIYHYILIITAFSLVLLINAGDIIYFYRFAFFNVPRSANVCKNKNAQDLDGELKKLP